uniref:Nucleolar pre-ribosomal-associated protein 1 C-terminal domain-containing protein n=1 Tax=Strigamia maritima TaxID=126957 RepID=T1ITS2_STRMM
MVKRQNKTSLIIETMETEKDPSDELPTVVNGEDEANLGLLGKSFSITNWLNGLNEALYVDNTPSLHKFIAFAENFDNKVSKYDIVLDLLKTKDDAKTSPYKKLLNVLEKRKLSAEELGNLYRVLELILFRIVDDLPEYTFVGTDIVQHVCSNCMTNVYWLLGNKKAQLVKKTLKLLSVFVLFNPQAAGEVMTHFDFTQASVMKLQMRTDIKDEQSVRVCYIYFLLSFLFTDDDKIIFQLMEKAELFKQLFVYLIRDAAPVINQFLSTILDKVICNKAIPKTLKVRLVNGSTLFHIARLYTWNGQQAWSYKKKRGGGKFKKKQEKQDDVKDRENIDPIPDDQLTDEQKQVYDITNQFLLALCCSYQYGIIFHDYQLGAGKHVNFLVTQMLFSIKNPHKSSYVTNLFVQILSSAPDQLKFYTGSIKNIIQPRASNQWILIMNFLTRIYDAQNIGQFLTGVTTKTTTKEIVNLSSTILFPSIISRDVIRESLKNASIIVNGTMLHYLSHLVQRLSRFCAWLKDFGSHKLKCLDESDIPAIVEGVGKSAVGVLLETQVMDELWESMKQPSDEKTSRFVELDMILNIETTLKQLFPSMMINSQLDLMDILENTQDLSSVLTQNEVAELQLKIVELLVKTESKKLLSSPMVATLIDIILTGSFLNKSKAPALLIEMFIESNVFNSSDEIYIWCNNFFRGRKKSNIAKFFVAVIVQFLQMKLKNGGKQFKASAGTVSCMVEPAFKILSENETFANDIKLHKFLSNVLTNVYHAETDKKLIENILKKNKSLLPGSFQQYMHICSLNGGLTEFSEIEVPEGTWHSLILLMKYRKVKFLPFNEDAIIQNIKSLTEFDEQCLIYQILFYIDIVLNEQNPFKTEITEFLFKLLGYLVISPKDGAFQKGPCSIVFSHPAVKKCFLSSEFHSASNLVLELIMSVNKYFHEAEPFSWYCSQTMTFVVNLGSYEKEMNLQMKEVVAFILKHVTNVEVVRVFESLSENAFVKHSWLAKLLCLRICDIVSQDHLLRLSATSAEILLRQINNKLIALEVMKLIKAVPAYCYCFKPGALRSFLVDKKLHAVKVLGFALSQSGFLRKEFEDLCQDDDLNELNHKSTIKLLEVYLQSHKSLLKNLSTDQKSIIEKVSLVAESLEKRGILNMNTKTIDIYLDLIDLNVKDWESIEQTMKTEILEVEDDKDLERIQILCRLSNAKDFWNYLMKKCFKRVQDDLQLYLLKSLLLIQEKVKAFATKYSKLKWNELIQNVLLISLNEVEKSEFLEFMLEFIRKYNIYVEAEFISDMIFGHSNFFTIMLAHNVHYSKSKELLVDIIIELTKRDAKIIKSSNIPLLLASYNVTLSLIDQKILYLLHLYHLNGTNFDEYKPFLWGRMAINFYSVRKATDFAPSKMPAVEDVLQHFDKVKLTSTAMNFPTDLLLQPEINENINDSSRLDPRFLFPLLSTLLAPSSFLNCLKFLDCKILPVIFASLSSNCSEMRKTGYYTLMLFNEHLDKAKYNNKGIWLHLLSALKNGIETENRKIPNVLSVYLAKVTPALHSFEDPLHKIVANFLLLKSDLNMNNIPDFMHLFSSSYLEHGKHREWILNLLIDGVKDISDYFLCEHKFVTKIVFSFCDSAVCKQESIVQILILLSVFADIPTATRRLVTLGGVLPYLHRILVKHGSTNSIILTCAICFLNKLWFSMTKAKKYDALTQESEPIDADQASDYRVHLVNMFSSAIEFHLVCNACMDLIAANPRLHDWEVLTSTLASIYDHISSRSDMKFYASTIASTEQIEKVLCIHKIVMEKNRTSIEDLNILDPRFSSVVSASNKLAVEKILLQFCLWSMENDSFRTDVTAFYQACFSVIEYILTSSYCKETAQYQMEFLKFIEKLFSIETHEGELIARQMLKRTTQNDNILSGLLQCYSYHNPYSKETISITLLTQLNITMRTVLMEIRHDLTQWFIKSKEEDRLMWAKAVDCYNAISHHKSAVTVSTQCLLSILACEFLLRKTTPHLFDSLARTSGLFRKLRKRSLEKNEIENDSKAKHKKRC